MRYTAIICPLCLADGNLNRTFRDEVAYRWNCPIHGPILNAIDLYAALPSLSKS